VPIAPEGTNCVSGAVGLAAGGSVGPWAH
jgi:hypothetical protein